MPSRNQDTTRRFSDRVENYVRYRPGYPDSVISMLQKETELSQAALVADIGSGTGISTELFLKHGYSVYAVEPNDDMRKAAESWLSRYRQFHSVIGTAEATTLAYQSIDIIIAAQAFHWFNTIEAKKEFARVLKPNGWIVLLWNKRIVRTPFQKAYEALLQQYGTDYHLVKHTNIRDTDLEQFFGQYRKAVLQNQQILDYAALKGRLLSSSYTPVAGDDNYMPMLKQLECIFAEFAEDGRVTIDYDTEVYFGQVSV